MTNDFAGINNFAVIGYDPYHLTQADNVQAMLMLRGCTTIVCNNVLNVLTDQALHACIQELKGMAVIAQSDVYITVYEGDRTGKGRNTKKDCYQRNATNKAYVEVLQSYFPDVTCKYGIIKCSI